MPDARVAADIAIDRSVDHVERDDAGRCRAVSIRMLTYFSLGVGQITASHRVYAPRPQFQDRIRSMTKVADTPAIDIALDHLQSVLAILDQADLTVEAAMTDHVIQMLKATRTSR
ncbi:hypothetical protein [Sphingomonas sp. CFBP 8760]|uniref:hypothetical protein n=1 Tax=Sphingomonas sp. CFBP 8760 TaxID=2775282 RepID=UPI001786B560|nr:hypothetical protein [Sphingomonas sp. CFBP 8760]MBD8547975.1 hypothetical protein [Sphingomonas sp. CFBP 8760]